MRKLLSLLVTGLFALGVAGSSQAGTFDPEISTAQISLAGLPVLTVLGEVGTGATLSATGATLNTLNNDASIWVTTNYNAGTSVYTGTPTIDNLFFTFQNLAGAYAPGFVRPNAIGPGVISGFGGASGSNGVSVIAITGGYFLVNQLAGGADLAVSSSMGGFTQMAGNLLVGDITQTAMPYFTGSLKLTNINTGVQTITTGARAGMSGCSLHASPNGERDGHSDHHDVWHDHERARDVQRHGLGFGRPERRYRYRSADRSDACQYADYVG